MEQNIDFCCMCFLLLCVICRHTIIRSVVHLFGNTREKKRISFGGRQIFLKRHGKREGITVFLLKFQAVMLHIQEGIRDQEK